MPNVLTLKLLANELLRCLTHGELRGRRALYCDCLEVHGGQQGYVVRIPKPFSFSSMLLSPDILAMGEEIVSVVLDHHMNTTVAFPRGDLSLSIDHFQQRYLAPLAASLSAQTLKIWPPGATLVSGALCVPPAALCTEFARVADSDSGLAVRLVTYYDIINDLQVMRGDMLFGFMAGEKRLLSPMEIGAVALLRQAEARYAAQRDRLRKAA